MKKIQLFLLFAVFAMACENNTNTQEADTQNTEMDAPLVFGEDFETGTPIGIEELLAMDLSDTDSVQTVVYGKVEEVCQKKGCWMSVYAPQDKEKALFVRFKDYGFFVPKDFAGAEIAMNGQAFKDVTSVEDLRHYAEDAGESEEEIAKITEPRVEYKFYASGVKTMK